VGEEPTIGSHEADVGDKDIEFWDERGDDCVIGENFWRATGTVAPRKSSTLLLDKPAVRWFHGCAELLTVKIRQPSHEFTFGVGISFIPYPLVLTPVV
jgi:hypothetical protein